MPISKIITASCFTLLFVAGCTQGDRTLHDLDSSGAGPDEFSVQPARPLEIPSDFNSLPSPTPGGTNLTDPSPNADAIVALGGNPASAFAGGIPAGDQALVSAAGRHGVNPDIRQDLAEADAQFRNRRSRGLFGRGGDRYYRAYSNQTLDAHSELERFRAAGVSVPSAPPEN